jgi:hypothetical protein
VLRAGVVARERVTAGLDGLDAGFFFRGLRAGAFRFFLAVRLAVWRLADREGLGLRDEDFTDDSPGIDGNVEVIPEVYVPKEVYQTDLTLHSFFLARGPSSHESR